MTPTDILQAAIANVATLGPFLLLMMALMFSEGMIDFIIRLLDRMPGNGRRK